MKRIFTLSLIFLINIQLFGTIVSPKSYLTDFQNHTLFLKSSIFKQTTPQDTGQVTIITTNGDTIQATILRVTKIAYKIKYKKVKHKKSGTVTKIKRRKLKKSIIQKIIYPDGRTINVAQKFKTVVEKKIKKLFYYNLAFLLVLIILFSYLKSKQSIILLHLFSTPILAIIGLLVFLLFGYNTFRYEMIALLDYNIKNLYTITLIPFASFYFVEYIISLFSLAFFIIILIILASSGPWNIF